MSQSDMDTKLFLKEFAAIASAPNGVQKLREMVLQLAMQGALTTQLPEDGHAKDLIAFALKQKNASIVSKQFKTTTKLEGLVLEIPRAVDLPTNWGWVRLLDLGEINPRNECDDDADASFLPMGSISHTHRGALTPETRKWREIKKGFTHVADGDVILAKITPCFENGKSAVVSGLVNGVGAGTTELHVFRALPDVVELGYVYLFLRSPHFALVGEANMTGTAGQKRLPTEYFASRAMPLPPLAEQKRIVAKVDALMALCDRLEALQTRHTAQRGDLTKELLSRLAQGDVAEIQHTLQNLSHLITDVDQVPEVRKAILSLAVQGKLVPQNPADESARVLLKRAEQSILNYLIRNGVRASREVEYSDAKGLFSQPSGWEWAYLRDFAIIQGGKRLPNGATFSSVPTQRVYIRVSDMKGGTVSRTDLKFIAEDVWKKIERYIISKDDLYVTIAGTIGDVGVIPDELDGQNLTENAAKIIFRDIDKQFLRISLTSQYVQNQFLDKINQMAQPKLALKRIAGVMVCIPPLMEQKRIVAKVDELMALCDRLEAKLRKASEVQEMLATATVAALTGIQTQEKETMKAPKTELVARLRLGSKPKTKDHAPLASLLVRHNNELSPNALLQHSSLSIDEFYQQLKFEMNQGWIVQPEAPSMKVEERR